MPYELPEADADVTIEVTISKKLLPYFDSYSSDRYQTLSRADAIKAIIKDVSLQYRLQTVMQIIQADHQELLEAEQVTVSQIHSEVSQSV